jgi:HKD family nuclease
MTSLPNGLYDLLLDARIRELALRLRDSGNADIERLTGDARRRRLTEVLARLLPDLLEEAADAEDDSAREQRELALINGLLIHLRQGDAHADEWTAPVLALRAIYRGNARPAQPPTGLLAPWLFTAGRADPSLFSELRAELGSADRVDIVVSFITWSDLRKLLDVLESVTAIGADGQPQTRLRVITTTYTGATEARAVEALAALPGVELRISLDGRRSRLHAKAWLFQRTTGFGTAFVGSANLSAAALLGGVEWTVKFTQAGQADLYAAAEAHFETLWNDPEFQRFDPHDDTHRAHGRQSRHVPRTRPTRHLPRRARRPRPAAPPRRPCRPAADPARNSAGPDTPAGRRYCESPGNGWKFQLFVREVRGQAYRALGPVTLERWEGDRPLSITWRLDRVLSVRLFRRYSVLRA